MATTAQTAEQEAITQSGLVAAVWKALSLFAILAALTLGLFLLAYFGNGPMRSIGFVSKTAPLQMVIGNDVFAVPQNMFRHGEQRQEGLTDRVDLMVHWPSGAGYRPDLLDAFSATDPAEVKTVLISIAQRRSLLDMRARFQPALKRAIVDGSVRDIGHGLMAASLDPSYGFIEEKLVYSQQKLAGGDPVFVARCQKPHAHERLLHACETDMFVGLGGVARVRFAHGQLTDWRNFQAWLEMVLTGLRVTNAG
ncbi:MAG: hypothetical protein AAF940_04130 [Pseudomonadota bacterium]